MAVLAAFPARSRFRGDGSRDASVEVYSDREMRIDGVELLERFQEKGGRDVWHYVTRGGPAQDVRSLLIELSQYGEATRAVVDRMLKDLSKPLEVPW
ncbi:hypothetical protein [Thermogymnomonas acidicola]|uniref:hypothetical protein n=1 Tax=Thermogymnomonas acidicola TaxID=399579 RepID=UPI0009465DEC|nr:hypothetical protein [Thermogymnomonas acidicola]